MDPETAWEELTAAALLGTERRPFRPPATPEPLAAVLEGLAGREPEKALLASAAAVRLFLRAGRRPGKAGSPPPEPAERDDRPRCSTASNGHLAMLLAGTHADVLPEWLRALARSGRRPADETVADLLELGRKRVELRPEVIASVGPLGAWLARQNPEWSYVGSTHLVEEPFEDDATLETLWESGTTEERTALLGRIRRSRPDRARELVASIWGSEDPEARAGFLETFQTSLTLDDEPFLEAALDDRRKEVRAAASDLLKRLPGSALVLRMIERVAPLLKLVEPHPGALVLEASLPEARDKGMTRDGIDSRFSGFLGLGEKANWLYQMVARIPPSTWSSAWGRTPAELAGAVVLSEWAEALYPALIEAAILHHDDAWNEALVARCLPPGTKANLFEQIRAQSPERREAMILSMIRHRPPDGRLGSNIYAYMHQVPAPWSDELSRLALERSYLFTTMGDRYQVSIVLGDLGLRVSTSVALEIAPNLTFPVADPPAYLIEQVNTHFAEYQALIQFRHEMTRELRR